MVADTVGTWLAGKEGPAAMIMPALPQPGKVVPAREHPRARLGRGHGEADRPHRAGPARPGRGAMVGRELHDDGSRQDKIFAPGYGEFCSSDESDLEAMALAVPTDAVTTPMPAELTELHRAALGPAPFVRPDACDMARLPRRRASAPGAADDPRAASGRRIRRRGRGRSTCSSSTGRRPRSTASGSSCGPGARGATPPPAGAPRCAATSPRSHGSATGSPASLDALDRVRLDRRLGELEADVADGDLRAAARSARALGNITLREAS